MSIKTKYTVVFITALSIIKINAGHSQDLKADLVSMYQAYTDLNNFYSEIEIKVFADAVSNVPVLTKRAAINKKGEDFFYTIDDLTMLYNEKCILMVNDTQKSIVYTKKDKKSQKSKNMSVHSLVSPQLDSLLTSYRKINYNGIKPLGKHYTIISSKSIIQRTDMFLDEKTHLINQLIYEYNPKYYGKKNIVKILFKSMDLAPKFQKDTFSEKKYVVAAGEKLEVSSAYKNYELIMVDTKNEKFK